MNNKQFETENELAVPVEVQQKAALYALATTLTGTGKVPNKRAVKKMSKRLRREVHSAIGKDGGDELMMQNKGALEIVLKGIREDPSHVVRVRKQLLHTVITEWYSSYLKGLEKLGYGKS